MVTVAESEGTGAPSGEKAREGSASGVLADPPERQGAHLSVLQATALSGNDLLGSCLYVVGLAIATAGWSCPISLLMVVGVLYLFRFIYGEVVMSLPVNGGCYSCLLNGTSKPVAAIAAVLTTLSYIATAVVSANSAASYALSVTTSKGPAEGGAPSEVAVQFTMVAMLAFACFLVIMGIGESAQVAVVMFLLHLSVMALLIIMSFIYGCVDGFRTLKHNFEEPLPTVEVTSTPGGAFFFALFIGFGQAMLGVSGFETSANTVEEQESGIYPSVLRNMWICVSLYNPLLALSALTTVPIPVMVQPENAVRSLVLVAAYAVKHPWLTYIVAIDAAIVLAGSVLTAFVGISGLVRRMALDRCLPAALLQVNSLRGTMHWIPIAFFLLTTSLTFLVRDADTLAAVYSLSFIGVMGLFAVGCLLLKRKRPSLRRPVTTNSSTAVFAVVAVVIALSAIIVNQPVAVRYFAIYGAFAAFVVYGMIFRVPLLALLLPSVRYFLREVVPQKYFPFARRWAAQLTHSLAKMRSQPIVIFAKHADIVALNKSIVYARTNEQTSRVCVVHVLTDRNTGRHAVEALRRQLGHVGSEKVRKTTDDEVRFDDEMQRLRGTGGGGGVGGYHTIDAGAAAATTAGGGAHRAVTNGAAPRSAADTDAAMVSGFRDSVAVVDQHYRAQLAARAGDSGSGYAVELGIQRGPRGAAAAGSDELFRPGDGPDEGEGEGEGEDDADLGTLELLRAEVEADRFDGVGASLNPEDPEFNNTEVRELAAECRLLNVIYPKVRVDLLVVRGSQFDRKLLENVGTMLGITTNLMFISCPDTSFQGTIASLGGVRVITTPNRPLGDEPTVRVRRRRSDAPAPHLSA